MTQSELFAYAIHHYTNPSCRTAEEFSADFNIPKSIKRLLKKKEIGAPVSLRMVLNHFMTMYNVFTPSAATTILFLKIEPEFHPIVKTIATFLNYMPDSLDEIGINTSEIELDQEFVEFLRSI